MHFATLKIYHADDMNESGNYEKFTEYNNVDVFLDDNEATAELGEGDEIEIHVFRVEINQESIILSGSLHDGRGGHWKLSHAH